METIADADRIGRYMIRSPLVLERLNWYAERVEVTRLEPQHASLTHEAAGYHHLTVCDLVNLTERETTAIRIQAT